MYTNQEIGRMKTGQQKQKMIGVPMNGFEVLNPLLLACASTILSPA